MIGRSHICRAITGELGGRAIGVPINPEDEDIVACQRAKLRKDGTLCMLCTDRRESRLLYTDFVQVRGNPETTVYRRRRRPNVIGNGLGLRDACREILERWITVDDRDKVNLQ